MSWTPPPPPGADRPDGPTDQPPWAGPAPIPSYSPAPHLPGQPEDTVPTAMPPSPPPQLRYADWGERVAAFFIDITLLIVLTVLVAVLTSPFEPLEDVGGYAWIWGGGYLAWLNGSKGQTPGKAVLGLKVVRDVDGSHLGGLVGVLRGALLWIPGVMTGFIFFLVSALWPLGDARKQALHDKMVNAVVISGYPRPRWGLGLLRPRP